MFNVALTFSLSRLEIFCESFPLSKQNLPEAATIVVNRESDLAKKCFVSSIFHSQLFANLRISFSMLTKGINFHQACLKSIYIFLHFFVKMI